MMCKDEISGEVRIKRGIFQGDGNNNDNNDNNNNNNNGNFSLNIS